MAASIRLHQPAETMTSNPIHTSPSQVTQLSCSDLALKHERAIIIGCKSTKFWSFSFLGGWRPNQYCLCCLDKDAKRALKLAVMQRKAVILQACCADSLTRNQLELMESYCSHFTRPRWCFMWKLFPVVLEKWRLAPCWKQTEVSRFFPPQKRSTILRSSLWNPGTWQSVAISNWPFRWPFY